MNQFWQDMIHLTEGEKFIKYWWLWLAIIVMVFIVGLVIRKGES
jgi:hypothetical protein